MVRVPHAVARISTHAPVKGATRAAPSWPCASDVRPTRRGRERLTQFAGLLQLIGISTHAPVKGATTVVPWRRMLVRFQPTLP